MSYTIARAKREDIVACMTLNALSMPETYSPQFWTLHYNQYGDMFFVAKAGEEVVGYVLCRDDTINRVRTGIVISIAVDARYQGQGIGEELMKRAHFAMRMRNIPMAGLQVRKTNKSAIALYNKFGYRASLSIPNYYMNPPEDGWLMTYVL